MKVSVLMPIYRTDERFLREAIVSVLAQTFGDFELLLLDDCPDDDRESVVKSYKDARIFYVRNDRNLGIAASRNRLLDLAKGEYLAVFDHDDIWRGRRVGAPDGERHAEHLSGGRPRHQVRPHVVPDDMAPGVDDPGVCAGGTRHTL